MGWFSKDSDGKASSADATALRDAFCWCWSTSRGELPRSEAQRVRELSERLQTFRSRLALVDRLRP